MIKRRRRIRTTTEEAEVLSNLCHLEQNTVIGISKRCHLERNKIIAISNLCHLERNKVIGEADDLVQSKDPTPLFLPTLRQRVLPVTSTCPTATRGRPARFFGSSRGYGVLRLRETFTFVKFSLRSG